MASILEFNLDDQLKLRQIQKNDAENLFNKIDKNRQYLRKFLNWVDGTRDVNDSNHFIQQAIKATEQLKGITFVITKDNEIIGSASLYDWQHATKIIHVGYWLEECHSRKGITTQIAKKLLSYAFEDLEMNKVQIYYSPSNHGSERIADKLGFKIEGYIRESYFINGKMEDQYLAGLLKHEYFIHKAK